MSSLGFDHLDSGCSQGVRAFVEDVSKVEFHGNWRKEMMYVMYISEP